MSEKKLYRSTTNKMVAGVCAGLADYLGIDVSIVRITFAALTVCTPIGAPLYFIMWVIVPEDGTVAGVDGSTDIAVG